MSRDKAVLLELHGARAGDGEALGRSAESARKLWSRSLIHLAEELGPAHDPRD